MGVSGAIDFGAVFLGEAVPEEFAVSLTQAAIDQDGTAVASYKIGVTGGNLLLCPATVPCLGFTNNEGEGDTTACGTMAEGTDESDRIWRWRYTGYEPPSC